MHWSHKTSIFTAREEKNICPCRSCIWPQICLLFSYRNATAHPHYLIFSCSAWQWVVRTHAAKTDNNLLFIIHKSPELQYRSGLHTSHTNYLTLNCLGDLQWKQTPNTSQGNSPLLNKSLLSAVLTCHIFVSLYPDSRLYMRHLYYRYFWKVELKLSNCSEQIFNSGNCQPRIYKHCSPNDAKRKQIWHHSSLTTGLLKFSGLVS